MPKKINSDQEKKKKFKGYYIYQDIDYLDSLLHKTNEEFLATSENSKDFRHNIKYNFINKVQEKFSPIKEVKLPNDSENKMFRFGAEKSCIEMAERKDGKLDFEVKGKFSGVALIDRIDSQGNLIKNSKDAIIYKDGKVAGFILGELGESRLSNLNKYLKHELNQSNETKAVDAKVTKKKGKEIATQTLKDIDTPKSITGNKRKADFDNSSSYETQQPKKLAKHKIDSVTKQALVSNQAVITHTVKHQAALLSPNNLYKESDENEANKAVSLGANMMTNITDMATTATKYTIDAAVNIANVSFEAGKMALNTTKSYMPDRNAILNAAKGIASAMNSFTSSLKVEETNIGDATHSSPSQTPSKSADTKNQKNKPRH